MEQGERPELLPAVVDVVLAALPTRFAPSRGFVSACAELAAALADAFLMAEASLPPGCTWEESGDEAQLRLESLVGRDCARAWWADAIERLQDKEAPLAGGDTMAEATLLALMRQSTSNTVTGRSVAATPGGGRPTWGSGPAQAAANASGADTEDAVLRFGVSWVFCALEDVVGSVAAHCTRRTAAAAPPPRPPTAEGARPRSSAGSSRPATGGPRLGSSSGRPGSSAGAARPATPLTRGAASRAVPIEKPRLLALKHFVGAVKGDEGLLACPVLETCLAEVATGVAPHVDTAELLACAPYQDRILRWAAQDADGSDEGALDRALAQALKSVSSAPAAAAAVAATSGSTTFRPPERPRGNAGAGTRAPARATGPAGQGQGAAGTAAAATPTGRPRGWLTPAFVSEFNAEGDEVLPVATASGWDDADDGPDGQGAAPPVPAARPMSSRGRLHAEALVQTPAQAAPKPTPTKPTGPKPTATKPRVAAAGPGAVQQAPSPAKASSHVPPARKAPESGASGMAPGVTFEEEGPRKGPAGAARGGRRAGGT